MEWYLLALVFFISVIHSNKTITSKGAPINVSNRTKMNLNNFYTYNYFTCHNDIAKYRGERTKVDLIVVHHKYGRLLQFMPNRGLSCSMKPGTKSWNFYFQNISQNTYDITFIKIELLYPVLYSDHNRASGTNSHKGERSPPAPPPPVFTKVSWCLKTVNGIIAFY
uniref:Uncharacterized protein n=1 Tax=Sus scrofa TaxID=9823 RepID=A0A8D1QE36_PIG